MVITALLALIIVVMAHQEDKKHMISNPSAD